MARRPAGPRDGGRRGRTGAIAPDAATLAKAPLSKASATPADPDFVLLGEFGRPHGLNGEVRLKSYTAEPRDIAGYGTLLTADGRSLALLDVRPAPGAAPDILIARVQGVSGRTAAEALSRLGLYVPRERLGDTGDPDEVFTADLVGAAAVDAGGVPVGTVIAVPNYGGGDLLEIRSSTGGATALLPFTKAFVPALDLDRRRITVALPEDFFAGPEARPADDPG